MIIVSSLNSKIIKTMWSWCVIDVRPHTKKTAPYHLVSNWYQPKHEDGIGGEDAAVPEEKDTTDGGLSVHPVAAVLREEHQLQFVTAGVRIHLRTTSSVIFHRLSDATISDSHNASYVIHCMHCVYLWKIYINALESILDSIFVY